MFICVDMYMCMDMIVSCMSIRAYVAFMTMYSAVRIPLVSNCAKKSELLSRRKGVPAATHVVLFVDISTALQQHLHTALPLSFRCKVEGCAAVLYTTRTLVHLPH